MAFGAAPMSDDDKIDFIICMRVSDGKINFTDDKFGLCSRCRAAIRFRPNVPEGPPKVCLQCSGFAINEAAL
jgi:hypothetical protein